MSDATKQLKHLWETVAKSPVPMAVFVFDHGIEQLPMSAETELQERQAQLTLRQFQNNLVGIYDNQIDFMTLVEDIAFARSRL